MPKDWVGRPMGSPSFIRQCISEVLPGVDWSDENWGRYDGGDFSLEFSVDTMNPSDGFGVFVHGSGDAVAPIVKIAQQFDWYVLDTSEGEWIHHCRDTSSGWHKFQAYRDYVIGRRDPDSAT